MHPDASPRAQDSSVNASLLLSLSRVLIISSATLSKPTFDFPINALGSESPFHFPTPASSRHQPPPHPDPNHRSPPSNQRHAPLPQPLHPLTPPIGPRPSSRSLHQISTSVRPHSFAGPATATSSQLPPARHSKRPLSAADRAASATRFKKIKLRHLHFRSHLLFYTPSPLPLSMSATLTPDKRLNPTRPCFVPMSKAAPQPRWLNTPASADGRASRLCPTESQWSGTGQSWLPYYATPNGYVYYPWTVQQYPNAPYCSPFNFRHAPPMSFPNMHSPSVIFSSPDGTFYAPRFGPQHVPPPPPRVSQAAPLKAQLLALLRMRSNTAPGEASLRFKKWVFWNGKSQINVPSRYKILTFTLPKSAYPH